jgi:hypothetical protein
MISKVYYEILVSTRLVQNLEISDLAMAKVEKVNFMVAYFSSQKIYFKKSTCIGHKLLKKQGRQADKAGRQNKADRLTRQSGWVYRYACFNCQYFATTN